MDKAMELLQELATKLGTTVETLWPYYVRYVWAHAFGYVAIFLMVLVVMVIAWKRHWNARERVIALAEGKIKTRSTDEEYGITWLLGLITTAYFVVLFVFGPRVIATLIAPGGAALRELLKIVGGE